MTERTGHDEERTFAALAPVRGGGFARTWWGRAWLRALEDAALDGEQVKAGRRLARAGAVGASPASRRRGSALEESSTSTRNRRSDPARARSVTIAEPSVCMSALVISSSATSSISSARSRAPHVRTAAPIMCRASVSASGSPGATCCWSRPPGSAVRLRRRSSRRATSSSPPRSSATSISRSARSSTSSGPVAISVLSVRMPSSRSAPGCSMRPSVQSSSVCPGNISTVPTGYSRPPNSADSPRGSPPSTATRWQEPSVCRISGSMCPARTTWTTPVDRSASAYRQVAKRSVSSSCRKAEARAITVAGVWPSVA